MTRAPASRRGLLWTLPSLAMLAAGCAAALGLDAPTLDPCVNEICDDAMQDAFSPEAATDGASSHDGAPADSPTTEGAADAPHETSAETGPENGVRCGGGSFGAATYCMPGSAAPTCCQTTTDAGVTTYGCVASETACSGYAITCATYNDCAGSEICCHYSTHMVCGSSCLENTDVVCDPTLTDSCPTGYKCDVDFTNGNVLSPYMGCSQQ
jgi:hypothetical protein